MRLTGLYTWRNVCKLGFAPLESYLSTRDMLDDAIICVDPASDDETVELAYRLRDWDSKVRVVEFAWPVGKVSGDGSLIGVASSFTLAQATGDWVANIQADEVYCPELTQYLKDNWERLARSGVDCLRLKLVHTEHNVQQYQGLGNWDHQNGAGYQYSEKLARRCPAIRMAHDAWRFEGCALLKHIDFSNQHPIMHLHDRCRDSLIDLRQTAANQIWTDRERFGNYKFDADKLEQTRDEWWNDPKWTATTTPFAEWLPDYALPLIGQTTYKPRYELLR